MLITADKMKTWPFQPCRKTHLIHARPLTEADYRQREGCISTEEGRVAFRPGDYLAKGIHDEEWPIAKHRIEAEYERVLGPDAEGFCKYRSLITRQAFQISHRFTLQYNGDTILIGKPGDYVVCSGDNIWITERNIFERTYEYA